MNSHIRGHPNDDVCMYKPLVNPTLILPSSDYFQNITNCPPGFSDLPTALKYEQTVIVISMVYYSCPPPTEYSSLIY